MKHLFRIKLYDDYARSLEEAQELWSTRAKILKIDDAGLGESDVVITYQDPEDILVLGLYAGQLVKRNLA